MRRLTCLVTLPLLALVVSIPAAPPDRQPEPVSVRPRVPGKLRLRLRQRQEEGRGRFRAVERVAEWDVAETAIVVCDMWDGHYCKSSAQRVKEMVPRMNAVLTAARGHGVTIIHAPSGTMDVYAGTSHRKRMQQAGAAEPRVPLAGWCDRDAGREPPLPVDVSKCACDDPVVGPAVRKFSRQHPGLDILGYDGVSDSGREIVNFCEQQGIKNIVLMGVHTNMCVLGRPFGIRQMVKLGKNVVLVRDLTDAMYDPRQPPYVSHARGTEMVVEHIEKYWCPSIQSEDLTAVVPGSAGPFDTFVYVSVMGTKKIAVYKMDPVDGTLTPSANVATRGEAGALAVDPKRRFLFAALRSTGKLASFRIDSGTGNLTLLKTVPAGADPAHIATDHSGNFLLAAYYVAGKVTVHAIGKDGGLSDTPVQTVTTADKAHCVRPDPANRFAFVPHTGPNAIFQFAFDVKKGQLTRNDVPKVVTPPGTGPRHMVFHPFRDIAYVVNEQGGSVTAYRFDPKVGTLKAFQTVSTLPTDFTGANACAEIKIHPSGRFLYASNRGHDSIARFTVDGAGKLTATGRTPTEKTPRSFDLDADGKFLFAAGESSGKVAAYRIDRETGDLKRLKSYEVGKTPWCVMAVRMPARSPQR